MTGGSEKSARARLLATVRDALGHGGLHNDTAGAQRHQRIARRMAEPPTAVLPAVAEFKGGALIDAFVAALHRAAATSEALDTTAALPAAVGRYLAGHNLPARVRIGDDAWLGGLPWGDVPGLAVQRGPAIADDTASVVQAFAGVAETGTVVQLSGAAAPSSLMCLPEVQLVVLAKDRIVGGAEEVWQRLAAASAGAAGRPAQSPAMPRAVHWITGPSRTADIEQTLLMGAHGPRRLHILLVDGR